MPHPFLWGLACCCAWSAAAAGCPRDAREALAAAQRIVQALQRADASRFRAAAMPLVWVDVRLPGSAPVEGATDAGAIPVRWGPLLAGFGPAGRIAATRSRDGRSSPACRVSLDLTRAAYGPGEAWHLELRVVPARGRFALDRLALRPAGPRGGGTLAVATAPDLLAQPPDQR